MNIFTNFLNLQFVGSLPNSNRKIEPKLMRQLMYDSQIGSIISSGVEAKGLEFLDNRPSVGSLSATDQFTTDEIYRFWIYSQNIKESHVTGSEKFPGEFLKPSSNNIIISNEMLDLIVKYYIATYEDLEFRKPFGDDSENAITIWVKMNQFRRY